MTKENIYTKIAKWIISQDVNRGIKSKDIVEIADYIFDTKLTSAGIKKVKEALLDNNYINIQDAKDRKLKDEKYIVYLNGEPYYTANSYDEAMRVENDLYNASNTEEDFQSYYGNYPEVEIKKLRDSKIKDSNPRVEAVKDLYEAGGNAVDDIEGILEKYLGKNFKSKYEDMDAVSDAVWSKVYSELRDYYEELIEDGNSSNIDTLAFDLLELDTEKDARFRDSVKSESLENLLGTDITITQLNDNWVEFKISKSYPKNKLIELLKSAGVSRKDIEANQIENGYRIVNIYNADEYDFEFSIEDSKIKDSPDWNTLKNSKDFVLKRLFKELEEEKAKPMSVEQENNIADIKAQIRKRAKEIKNVPNDIYDAKIKDTKIKDGSSYALIKEDKYYDPEGLNIDENEKNILYVGGTKQECLIELEILHKELKDKYSRDESVSVSPITGSQFYVYFRDAISKDYYRVVEMHPNNIKDAKLTRKQKLWYAEELENMIHPQYLRRNYQLKKIKRGRRTK